MENNLLRVTQMNAIYLDTEIYNALYQLFLDSTKSLPPGLTALYESEIQLILKLMLLNNSVVKHGATFGQQLLSIKYDNMSSVQRVMYLLGHCLTYVKNKFELLRPSHGINNTLFKLDTVMKLLDFINLSAFLRNGVKPLLIERFLGLNQIYSSDNAQRRYDSKYLARELLWNGFIDILVYITPLINFHKLKRTVRNLNPFHVKKVFTSVPNRGMTTQSKCAHCGENPIIPHHMGCTHVFCYVCLKGNQAADTLFECPLCEHKNVTVVCTRVTFL
ncbi:peroxisome biogenesis factor 2 [Diorhabda carinulata]|uniref:peroxisome biogenesis factor 2 n=1 Tax=Diorhabda carinulata TaxID=1163345 RepID=UPI0025A08371|nr:peroxisome biogenesis factor 2 [Diorhabda carinulata]